MRIAGHRTRITEGVLERHREEMAVTETGLAPITVTDDQLALIKKTIAQGASDEELRLFLFDCKRQGVHPLDRLLHFTKRGGRYTPITSIDLMRTRAAETGECAGIDDATFDHGSPPSWARITVYRLTNGQRYPYTATARWVEYYPGDAQGVMWRKMPHTMLAKCAEALALRKAFPKQLSGLYAAEEMHQADREEPVRSRRTERAASPVLTSEPDAPEPSAETLFPPLPEVPTRGPEEEERQTLLSEIFRMTKVLKLSRAERDAYKKEFLGRDDADVMTADIGALNAMLADLVKRLPKDAA